MSVEPVTYEYGVADMAAALFMTDKDVRRVLRRIKHPKSPSGAYRWTTADFAATCEKVKSAAYPYE